MNGEPYNTLYFRTFCQGASVSSVAWSRDTHGGAWRQATDSTVRLIRELLRTL
jgi:hypothetical protein